MEDIEVEVFGYDVGYFDDTTGTIHTSDNQTPQNTK